MSNAYTLIKNGTIITLDPEYGVMENAEILIAGDTIQEVGTNISVDDANVIDAENMIVMPGLVNSHIHTWQAGLKGLGGNGNFYDYLELMMGKMAWQFTPDDLRLANLFGALEAINGGTTTLFDWCHLIREPEQADAAIDGLEESGIRAVFGYGSPPEYDYFGLDTELGHPEDAGRVRKERLSNDDGLVTMALCIRGAAWASYDVMVRDVQLARELDVIVSEHARAGGSETTFNPDDIQRRAKDGLLDEKCNFVHANAFSHKDFKLLADNGCSVSVTPQSEMQIAFGLPAIGLCRAAGMKPTIGTDTTSVFSPDMFVEMRMGLQWQRYVDGESQLAKLHDVGVDIQISAEDMLAFTIVEGARALGLADRIGSLTPGKQADIILIRTDELNTVSAHDPIQTVVLYAGVGNVDTVMVGGRVLKENGQMKFSALAERQAEFVQSNQRIVKMALQADSQR